MTIKQKQDYSEIFERGVSEFIDPDDTFKEKLEKKIRGEYPKDIVIKYGVDPTAPDIHLGHAVVFRKLRKFQDLGCRVVFLVGDFTAQIGDPSGKSKIRPELELKEIEKNMKTYLEQVGKILKTDKDVFTWIRNSDWFTAITDLAFPPGHKVNLELEQAGQKIKLSVDANSFIGKAVVFEQTRMQVRDIGLKEKVSVVTLRSFLRGLRRITHSRLIDRDLFQERIKKGEELFMHEVMYPVLQGIDSQVLHQIFGSCDLEIGGSDQTFNMLFGRDVMKNEGQPPQSVLATRLLEGTDGNEKMSKSLGNYIGITEEPIEMYGRVMSIPDSSIINYFELATYAPMKDIEQMKKDLEKEKVNPRDLKMRLAREIVAEYHGEDAASKAEEGFVRTFQKKEIPEEMPVVKAKKGGKLADVLLREKLVKSKSDFRRLVEEGAVTDLERGEKIEDPNFQIKEPLVLKIGKHRFVKIIAEE